jgi:TonB family protein
MRKAILLSFCIVITMSSAGQSHLNKDKGYSELETETEACIEKMMADNDAGMQELKTVFENYFSSQKISGRNAPLGKQYQKILDFLEHPDSQFPFYKEIGKVVVIREKLGLTEEDIKGKKQLYCLADSYLEHKDELDTNSAFYLFGNILAMVKEKPEISMGLIAGLIKNKLDKHELKKAFYQNAIVLMFVFDMSLFMTDGNENTDNEDNVATKGIEEELIEITKDSGSENADPGKLTFMLVEKMPEYPGGENELYRYLATNIQYPAEAKKKGIQGRVFVTFIIEQDGRVTDVRILRGIGGGCDEEALRVVRAMPRWRPGVQKGKPVRVQYNLPISFKLTRK